MVFKHFVNLDFYVTTLTKDLQRYFLMNFEVKIRRN